MKTFSFYNHGKTGEDNRKTTDRKDENIVNQRFINEIKDTDYLHRPLPLHREDSLEAGFSEKKIVKTLSLHPCAMAMKPLFGTDTILTNNEDGFTFSAKLYSEHWPEGASPDGDYANFGEAGVSFSFAAMDWRSFNRLRLSVRPRSPGQQVQHLNVAIVNEGTTPLPDPYFREGATVFDLEADTWQECIWEFDAMPRDAVTKIKLYVFLSGCDAGAPGVLTYDVRDIRLEQVQEPEFEHGWVNSQKGIRLSSVGYFPGDRKTAIVTTNGAAFRLIREKDCTCVLTGDVCILENGRGRFQYIDFSTVQEEGEYHIELEDGASCAFEISSDLARATVWRLINFFFCLRCGFPVPGKHGSCHQDIIAEHNGQRISFCGGWHDAGDVSQQAVQSAEITQALLECSGKVKEDEPLRLRLLEEARWGLDFILKTRFSDGFRATSAGATRFTDNIIGTFDDIPARVHDHAYENFLFSGVEAFAALTLEKEDRALAATALHAARQDFDFAVKKFSETGVDPAHMYEHTWNSGLSQYYAVRLWSASLLYRAAKDQRYIPEIRENAQRLMACQETGASGLPFTGFFYRDESHRTIVHFNHQSREHQFMQALEAACRALPDAPEKSEWEACMRRYGEYLKAIAGNTAPYGMLPDGVHRLDEAEDEALFPYLHVACNYAAEKENFQAQLQNGTPVLPGYVIRNFPIWFSFRGNSAVLLSSGKGASILAAYFDDPALRQIAHEQMYWMWGKNPFGQSLVYGDGSRWCRQYAVLCGECVGEVPVGIETKGNEDTPYWPQNNNATFREVWGAAACRLMWLCADTFL